MKRIFLILTFLLLITACAPTTEPPKSETTTVDTAVSQTETMPPPVITVDTPRVEPPTAVPESTQPASEPTIAAPTAEPVVEAVPEGGVVSARTPEGAFYLGDPNAPITHIDYSDFL